jgi:hypothetical protein
MKRRTLIVPKPTYEAANHTQERHGLGLSDLVRMALAEGISLERLEPYFPPETTEVQLQLNDQQWQQIQQIAQQAQQAGLGNSQADVLRALTVYQLNRINGGVPPG